VLTDISHWLQRIDRLQGMELFRHHGLAIGDVDGDGLDDLYVAEPGGLPNRLYVQNRDGTVRDTSAEAGVDWLEASYSALLLDLYNDGDQDQVVATTSGVVIAENDGSGQFARRGRIAGVDDPQSMAAADFDRDGDLDIYLCGYTRRVEHSDRAAEVGFGTRAPVPYHDANNGGANALLRNEGAFSFTNVTNEVGLGENNSRFSWAAAWEDYDDDGDPDLYVANDYGRNNLYRNDGGRFHDVAAAAGVEDPGNGMSVDWGDYDRDGDMDLYVGNMFSSAGRRIATQEQFAPGGTAEARADLLRSSRGNSLFANQGGGVFRDVSEEAGVTLGRWAWASIFSDLNNDGWQDLVVANGFFTQEDSSDI
jgi:hypothetical protein